MVDRQRHPERAARVVRRGHRRRAVRRLAWREVVVGAEQRIVGRRLMAGAGVEGADEDVGVGREQVRRHRPGVTRLATSLGMTLALLCVILGALALVVAVPIALSLLDLGFIEAFVLRFLPWTALFLVVLLASRGMSGTDHVDGVKSRDVQEMP